MTNKETIVAFLRGAKSGRNSNYTIFIEGDTIYSYGYHFPLGVRLTPKKILVNPKKYSVTTSRHTNLLTKEAKLRGFEIDTL